MDKFALVYEFNKESPLITYKASKELEAKNYSIAIDLLSSAINKYPYHSTAYFQYSLALAYNNQFEEAKEILTKANALLSEKRTFDYYSLLIDKIKREAEGISVNFDETVNEVLNESFLEPEEFNTIDELDLLEDDFESSEPLPEEEFEHNSIVTETLAEIYASQNNFEEALQIFEKLKIIKPELIEKFDKRIDELKIALDNKKQKRFGN